MLDRLALLSHWQVLLLMLTQKRPYIAGMCTVLMAPLSHVF